jgi:Dolichyl-phosphate-mannose-protein mannosyltransferase
MPTQFCEGHSGRGGRKKVFCRAEIRYQWFDMTCSSPSAENNRSGKIWNWCVCHPRWALALLTVVALAPFLAKPFNIDDPCYVWCAKQIQSHPADPYGFNVNWYGSPQPMWSVMQNPPLDCYFIALAAGIFGWSEPGIHLMFLLPAIAVILGTFRLAQKFCGSPFFAATATLFTPVFLVSSTAVMCDVPMLALWVWAVVFWVEGVMENKISKLVVAGILIALAVMTKYNGACLVPLLAAYSLLHGRRSYRWILCLLIPLATMAAYQIISKKLYGLALLTQASAYAGWAKNTFGFTHVQTGLTALAFTGGCHATTVFFMPLLWRKRTLMLLAGLASVATATVVFNGAFLEKYCTIQAGLKPFIGVQIVFWATGGILLLSLAVHELWKQRDAQAWLLLLWIFGVFSFSAFVNWTVNARTLLPMTPAVAILLARCLNRRFPLQDNFSPRRATWVLLAGGLLTLLLAQADFALAAADRRCAIEVHARYGAGKEPLWYDGNWGYQFYMDKLGASGVDVEHPKLKAGDILALPLNNSILRSPDPKFSSLQDAVAMPVGSWLTTSSLTRGAGFYAATIGPLPFAFCDVPPEYVCIFKMGSPKSNLMKRPQ